jgi:hypothetical protein
MILSQVLVVHACNPSYSGGRDQRITGKDQPGKIVHETLSQKYLMQKRAYRVAEVAEYLLAAVRP